MNEDKTFIRAIVDNPGDNTSRLVYADWLDDRDDPRGTYLRAEHEAVVTGDIARLRQLAVGLDPVWVARVSMPPIGVCIDGAKIAHCGPQITTDEIATLEDRIGGEFPADYKAFLLNYNGGRIDLPSIQTSAGEIIDLGIEWWFYEAHEVGPFPVRPDDYSRDEEADPEIEVALAEWCNRFVVVGHDPDVIGSIFIGVRNPHFGQVYIFDTSVELECSYRAIQREPRPYANSFTELLASILQ